MVKTVAFADPKYLGDPVNALRIFNTKEVDEIVILDITASEQGRQPDLGFVRELAGECFMPVSYGGGVRTVDQVEGLLRAGVEKVVVNTAFLNEPSLAADMARSVGSQAVTGSIDVKKKRLGGHRVANTASGVRVTGHDPLDWARRLEGEGVGEILLTSVDRDGTAAGYDLDLVGSIAGSLSVPVVACGGAGSHNDLRAVLQTGAAAAAGRLFVTHGRHLASLVSYPAPDEVEAMANPTGMPSR